MTEKKMRKWLKTFVMLLPIVFVVLFGVHLHRHELPESVEVQTGYEFALPEVGVVYEPQTITAENLYPAVGWSVSYKLRAVEGNYDTAYIYYSLSLNSFVGSSVSGFVKNDGDRVIVSIPFTIEITNEQENQIRFRVPVYTTYTEPLEVIVGSFNNYLDMYTNNNVFNLNRFYDWSVNTFFNGTAPLYYKPVFSILVYEFVIELLFLMFSFITFLIRFAQKWIDGLYERRF